MPYFILQLHVVELTLYMHFIFIFIRISMPIRENAINFSKKSKSLRLRDKHQARTTAATRITHVDIEVEHTSIVSSTAVATT